MQIVVKTLKAYPYSIGAFVLSLVPLIMLTLGYINMKLNPAPKGYADYGGEGLAYGSLVALLFAIIFILIMLANIIHQKNNAFYVKLIAVTIVIQCSLVWCFSDFRIIQYPF